MKGRGRHGRKGWRSGWWGDITEKDLTPQVVRIATHEATVSRMKAELLTCTRVTLEHQSVAPQLQAVQWISHQEQGVGWSEGRPKMGQVTRLDATTTEPTRYDRRFSVVYTRRGPYSGPYSALVRRGDEETWTAVETATWEQLCRLILQGVVR